MDYKDVLAEARGLAGRWCGLPKIDHSLQYEDLVQDAVVDGLMALAEGHSASMVTLIMRRRMTDRFRYVRYRESRAMPELTGSEQLKFAYNPLTEGALDVRREARADQAFAALLCGWTAKMYAQETGLTQSAAERSVRKARTRALALAQE